MNKKRLLLATDMTSDVEFALDYGIRLASVINADVHLLHVYTPQVMSVDGMIVTSPDAIDLRQKTFESYVKDIRERYDELDVAINDQFSVGFPVKMIIEVAEDMPAFVIVMATSRPNLLKQWLGSVSTEVMKHADVPILLVPPGSTFTGLNKIGYADDFSESHELGRPYLEELVSEFLSDVHLIHIGDNGESVSNWIDIESLEQQYHGVAFNRVRLSGHKVVPTLLEYAHEHDIQLLIVPTPKHGFLYQIFNMSVSKNLSLQSEIPMLVIH